MSSTVDPLPQRSLESLLAGILEETIVCDECDENASVEVIDKSVSSREAPSAAFLRLLHQLSKLRHIDGLDDFASKTGVEQDEDETSLKFLDKVREKVNSPEAKLLKSDDSRGGTESYCTENHEQMIEKLIEVLSQLKTAAKEQEVGVKENSVSNPSILTSIKHPQNKEEDAIPKQSRASIKLPRKLLQQILGRLFSRKHLIKRKAFSTQQEEMPKAERKTCNSTREEATQSLNAVPNDTREHINEEQQDSKDEENESALDQPGNDMLDQNKTDSTKVDDNRNEENMNPRMVLDQESPNIHQTLDNKTGAEAVLLGCGQSSEQKRSSEDIAQLETQHESEMFSANKLLTPQYVPKEGPAWNFLHEKEEKKKKAWLRTPRMQKFFKKDCDRCIDQSVDNACATASVTCKEDGNAPSASATASTSSLASTNQSPQCKYSEEDLDRFVQSLNEIEDYVQIAEEAMLKEESEKTIQSDEFVVSSDYNIDAVIPISHSRDIVNGFSTESSTACSRTTAPIKNTMRTGTCMALPNGQISESFSGSTMTYETYTEDQDTKGRNTSNPEQQVFPIEGCLLSPREPFSPTQNMSMTFSNSIASEAYQEDEDGDDERSEALTENSDPGTKEWFCVSTQYD